MMESTATDTIELVGLGDGVNGDGEFMCMGKKYNRDGTPFNGDGAPAHMISVKVPECFMERGPRPSMREYKERRVSKEFLQYIHAPSCERVKQIVRLFHKQPGLLMQVFDRIRDVDRLRKREEKATAVRERMAMRCRRVRADGSAAKKVNQGNKKAKAQQGKDTARAVISCEGRDEDLAPRPVWFRW